MTWQWLSLAITSDAVFSTACGFNELHGTAKGSYIWAGVLLRAGIACGALQGHSSGQVLAERLDQIGGRPVWCVEVQSGTGNIVREHMWFIPLLPSSSVAVV